MLPQGQGYVKENDALTLPGSVGGVSSQPAAGVPKPILEDDLSKLIDEVQAGGPPELHREALTGQNVKLVQEEGESLAQIQQCTAMSADKNKADVMEKAVRNESGGVPHWKKGDMVQPPAIGSSLGLSNHAIHAQAWTPPPVQEQMISQDKKAIAQTLGNSKKTGAAAELSKDQLQEALAQIKKEADGCWVSHVCICCVPLLCSLHGDKMEEKDPITIARNGLCCILCCPIPVCCDNVHGALLRDEEKGKIPIAEYARRKGEGTSIPWARCGIGEEKKDENGQCTHILFRKYGGCLYTACGCCSGGGEGCCCCGWFASCDCRVC